MIILELVFGSSFGKGTVYMDTWIWRSPLPQDNFFVRCPIKSSDGAFDRSQKGAGWKEYERITVMEKFYSNPLNMQI